MRIEYRKKALISEADQNLVFEMIKKFVLAWDPDFTKLRCLIDRPYPFRATICFPDDRPIP